MHLIAGDWGCARGGSGTPWGDHDHRSISRGQSVPAGGHPGDINGARNVCKTLNLADEAKGEIELLAKKIVVLAREAERDAAILRDRTLREMAYAQAGRRLVRSHSISPASRERLQARDQRIGGKRNRKGPGGDYRRERKYSRADPIGRSR